MNDRGDSGAVDFRVAIADLHGHRYRVTLTLPRPAPHQVFTLPVWSPGSYKVRDFSRHLSALSARQGRQPRAVIPLGTSRWQVDCGGRAALVLSYEVYAFDRSVRGAFLDAERGFFDGAGLFLRAEGRAAARHRLRFGRLPAGWRVASSMPPATTGPGFEAADHAELIDHPVLLGRPWQAGFEVAGVAHELVVQGAWPGFDGERLCADVQRLAAAQIRFWHPQRGGRPPFERYVFLLTVAEDGSGGLEHRASCALSATRRELPRQGRAERGEAYAGLLGLFSHEYFHAWNATRLKPREHAVLDLSREQPSTLLWFFEGFTAYYDELLLLRAGLVDRAHYLRRLARSIDQLRGAPGRRVHSVAAASFEAWTKFYVQDENTPNATVSYYAKGALLALLCDLTLRERGRTLDAAMRRLWRRAAGGPVDEAGILAALSAAAPALAQQLPGWVHGTAELPLASTLSRAGLRLRDAAPDLAALAGLRLSENAIGGVRVRQVLRGSAAEAAGLAPGDELLAVDGWRLRRLEDARQWVPAGRPLTLLLSRDQRVLTRRLRLPREAAAPAALLDEDPGAGAGAVALRRRWLGG